MIKVGLLLALFTACLFFLVFLGFQKDTWTRRGRCWLFWLGGATGHVLFSCLIWAMFSLAFYRAFSEEERSIVSILWDIYVLIFFVGSPVTVDTVPFRVAKKLFLMLDTAKI